MKKMRHLNIHLLLTLSFVLLIGTNGLTQKRLSKKDKIALESVCHSFISEQTELFKDTAYPIEHLIPYTSPELYQFLYLDRQFVKLMDYSYRVDKRKVIGVIHNDSGAGCHVSYMDTNFYELSARKDNNKWIIWGYDGEAMTEDILNRMSDLIDSAKGLQLDKQNIKTIVQQFFEGLNELYTTGQSNQLQSITSSLNYDVLALDKTLADMKGYKPKKYELEAIDYIQINTAVTANCRIITKNKGSSRLNLDKIEGQWIIVGENDNVIDSVRLNKTQKRVDDYYKLLSLKDFFPVLDSAMNHFLLNHDPSELRKVTSEDGFEILSHFRAKLSDHRPFQLQIRGVTTPHFLESDIDVIGDTAIYDFQKFTVHFLLKNGQWQLTHFADVPESDFNYQLAEHYYPSLLTFFGISYSHQRFLDTNGHDIDEVEERTDIDLTEPKVDTTIYHQPQISGHYYWSSTKYRPARFNGDTKALYQFIINENQQNNQGDFQIVYVQFVIEKDGAVTSPKIIKSVSAKNDLKALKIVLSFPKWNPAVINGSTVRSYYNLAIPVYEE